MQAVSIKRVGVLRGGDGEQYASSLKKGGDILSQINEHLSDKYKACDILIDKDGVWHFNGLPINNPSELIHKIDIVWNASHFNISNTLDSLLIPHISNGAFSGAMESSHDMLRAHMKKINMDMPRRLVLPVYQTDFDGPREQYATKKAREVHQKFGAPWIVKSFTPDANMAIHLAKTFNELVSAIEDGVNHNKSILIEEFITGKIASVHSIPNFRNQDVYHFPLGNTFGQFGHEEKQQLYSLAEQIRDHIGATHYLKSDFVINPRGKIYVLGVTTTPNFKPESHFAEVCEHIGIKTHHIIDHILKTRLS